MSPAAARSFSEKAKDTLKRKILEEGEDMGSQLPIIIARGKAGEVPRFDPLKKYGYFYEVVAGQHIIVAKKEIYEETAMEKDTCMCAVYMGVTEEEKMDLALHNATLQAIPFNVLDVKHCERRVMQEVFLRDAFGETAYHQLMELLRVVSLNVDHLCRAG
ncbi:unnamed protein product [Darwinula stevensoni]|uniref:Uncharacterized protein n=1 Tax=Darwinula stevensoni TaxID=69355 RepID=A0A7R9ABV4_9CRUS|nr:unnamed protein product [Darwinula stevensoni]CAG0899412.1 unnamed protein product [Darwinula stevensoni]